MTVASAVGLATGYRGNPRVSTARATAFHCTWRFHRKCHGCGHGTCRGSVRGSLRRARHANPRKYHGNFHGIIRGHAHVNCPGNPRQSMANATAFNGNCHGNPPTASAMEIRVNSTETHGIPPLSATIATAILQYAATATEFHGNCHGFPRACPWTCPWTCPWVCPWVFPRAYPWAFPRVCR